MSVRSQGRLHVLPAASSQVPTWWSRRGRGRQGAQGSPLVQVPGLGGDQEPRVAAPSSGFAWTRGDPMLLGGRRRPHQATEARLPPGEEQKATPPGPGGSAPSPRRACGCRPGKTHPGRAGDLSVSSSGATRFRQQRPRSHSVSLTMTSEGPRTREARCRLHGGGQGRGKGKTFPNPQEAVSEQGLFCWARLWK